MRPQGRTLGSPALVSRCKYFQTFLDLLNILSCMRISETELSSLFLLKWMVSTGAIFVDGHSGCTTMMMIMYFTLLQPLKIAT